MPDKKTMLKNALCAELEAIALANPFDFVRIEEYEKDGGILYRVVPINSEEIPEEKKKAVETLCNSTKGVEIKLHGKMKAIELLGKLSGLFDEQAREETENIPQGELDKIIHTLEDKLHIPHRFLGRRKKDA